MATFVFTYWRLTRSFRCYDMMVNFRKRLLVKTSETEVARPKTASYFYSTYLLTYIRHLSRDTLKLLHKVIIIGMIIASLIEFAQTRCRGSCCNARRLQNLTTIFWPITSFMLWPDNYRDDNCIFTRVCSNALPGILLQCPASSESDDDYLTNYIHYGLTTCNR